MNRPPLAGELPRSMFFQPCEQKNAPKERKERQKSENSDNTWATLLPPLIPADLRYPHPPSAVVSHLVPGHSHGSFPARFQICISRANHILILTFLSNDVRNNHMFGFKKNKKNEPEDQTSALPGPIEGETGESVSGQTKETPKKKKRFSLKKLIIILFVVLILAGGGFFAFTFFFQDKTDSRIYPEKILSHVALPDEMLRFCFHRLPNTYEHLVEYDRSLDFLEKEIQQIQDIGQKYPDQIKITDREKKVWEKLKKNLMKSFAAVQKSIREFYVLLQVNPDQGNLVIAEKKDDLAQKSGEFLVPVRKQLEPLGKNEKKEIPEGFFARLIYKVKNLL